MGLGKHIYNTKSSNNHKAVPKRRGTKMVPNGENLTGVEGLFRDTVS